MERFLLWLDELDDYLTIWAHGLGRIRHHSLQAGLAAALVLPLVDGPARSAVYANGLAALAAASVLIWTGAAAAELVARARDVGRGRRLEMN